MSAIVVKYEGVAELIGLRNDYRLRRGSLPEMVMTAGDYGRLVRDYPHVRGSGNFHGSRIVVVETLEPVEYVAPVIVVSTPTVEEQDDPSELVAPAEEVVPPKPVVRKKPGRKPRGKR